jgi:hypothetical protein
LTYDAGVMSIQVGMLDPASLRRIEDQATRFAEQIHLGERTLDQDWIKGVEERAALLAEQLRMPEPFGLDSATMKVIEEKAARLVEQIGVDERKLDQDWIKGVDERAALLAEQLRMPEPFGLDSATMKVIEEKAAQFAERIGLDECKLGDRPTATSHGALAERPLEQRRLAPSSLRARRRKTPRRRSPASEIERASVVEEVAPERALVERPDDADGAFLSGGQLVLDLRSVSVSFLHSAGLHDALEELTAIEERLETGGRVPIKHAADSTRRVIRAIAEHVFPARSQPYRDRWGQSRCVAAQKPVNRIMAFVDSRLGMQPEEQRALAAELSALWRSVSDDVHSVKSVREARYDYIRLLRMLAAIDRSLAL